MTLDKILSIGGKPGLYRLITQTRGGFVAESLLDKKRVTVGMRSNVSVLSEIAIYTLEEELPLREVFQKIKEKENGGKTSIGHKEDKIKLEEYLFEVLPNYDEDRVYASDIKKLIQWYNILHDNGITDFSDEKESDEKESDGKAAGDASAGKKSAGEKSGGEKSTGENTSDENSGKGPSEGETSAAGKTGDRKTSDKKSSGKQSLKGASKGKNTGVKTTAHQKSAPSKTSGKKVTQKNPAAKKK